MSFKSIQNEQGAVLITSMLILLVMTIIGITSMQSSSLEERMVGNMRDKDLAFQAAEAALREAEGWVKTSVVTTGAFTGANGLYGKEDDADSTTWGAGDSIEYSGTIDHVVESPRYIVQYAGERKGPSGMKQQSGYFGGLTVGGDATIFEITARGVGATDTSVVYLRTLYGRRL